MSKEYEFRVVIKQRATNADEALHNLLMTLSYSPYYDSSSGEAPIEIIEVNGTPIENTRDSSYNYGITEDGINVFKR